MNTYNKILVICGFSASGKDSIIKTLVSKFNFVPIISTTTRPIREKETNGIEYNFINNNQFEQIIKNNKIICKRSYNTLVNNKNDIWHYGIDITQIKYTNIDLNYIFEKPYVIILDIKGLIELVKIFGEKNIISIFLDVEEEIRKERCILRGDYNQIEWDRRYNDDLTQQDIINKIINYKIKNKDIENCINEILSIYNNNK